MTRLSTSSVKAGRCIIARINLQNTSQPRSITRSTWLMRRQSSMIPKPNSNVTSFPGAPNSKFTTKMIFSNPPQNEPIQTYRVLDANGKLVDPDRRVQDLDGQEVLKWYRNCVATSMMDERMLSSQRQGRISFYMNSSGEEAIAVGSAAALSAEDVIFCQYREVGVLMQRGFTLDEFMNQLFANKNDPGHGRNMPVHYGSKKLNVHTISSPLATQLPHAAGAAYALKLQDTQKGTDQKRIAVVYFGEGAASEGDFHAAMNFAAVRASPIVFICRNNGYAISTPTEEQYHGDGIASRGDGYGIETIRVDGNDIFAMWEATKKARHLALENGGKPVLIEAMSYRVSHHSTSDDSFQYRGMAEVDTWKRKDNPITRLRRWLEGEDLWNDEKEQQMRLAIKKELREAFDRAEAAQKPALRHLFGDVYAELTEEQKSQMAELKDMIERYPEEYDVSAYEGGLDSLRLDR